MRGCNGASIDIFRYRRGAAVSDSRPSDEVLLFGTFALSRSRKLLQDQGRPVQLGGRALELLLALTEHAGQLLTRQQLMALVWPNTVVEENSLRVHIAALRKALGDGRSDARYIANVPGRGYLFVMEVRRQEVAAALAPARAHPGVHAAAPAWQSTLVGRDEVIAQLAALVGERRMVSIVGPGGIGKTTVALAVSRVVCPQFPDGVFFVDLGALSCGDMLAPATAAALGVVVASTDAATAICRYASGRRMLVVLDNCEHVAEAAAMLAERVLTTTSDVRLLATSREALALHTESVVRLAPLASPLHGAGLSVAQALAYPALQLFVQRASADASGFVLTESNVESATFLCNQLDGNPLAIELAAARVESLGIEGLASRLGNLFGLLTRGRRTAFPRQQTLQATLDWSYRLLDETERSVFQRLSVFRNAFSLDWAVLVCAGERIGAAAVADSVINLGVKSLLSVETGSVETRYRMLNTTRLYAALRLEEAAAQAGVAERHARAMLAVYARADADLRVLPAAEWRERYAATADDFSAALDWAFSPGGDALLGIELTATSWFAMLEMGRVDEHRQRVARALAALPGQQGVDSEVELRLLAATVLIAATSNGGGPEVEQAMRRLDILMAQLGQPERSLQVLHAKFGWSFGQGHYPRAKEIATRIADVSAQSGDPVATLLGDRFMALCLHCLGEHRAAGATAQRVLDSTVTQRNVHLLGLVPRSVSMRILQARLLWIAGYPDQAVVRGSEAQWHAEGENPFGICQALATAVIPIALWRGDTEAAARDCERLAAIVNCYSLGYWESWVGNFREVLARRTGTAPSEPFCMPRNTVELDMLGTLEPSMVFDAAFARVRDGTVAWCGAEIVRARGEHLLRLHGAASKDAAQALFLEAIARARDQHERAWELRAATSLAALWKGGPRAGEGLAMLEQAYGRFSEGFDTADLMRAKQLLARPSHFFTT